MPSFSRNDVILVAYPFSGRTGVKVRPAVVVSGEHRARDVFVVPLMSKTDRMIEGEFSLADWLGHDPAATVTCGKNRRRPTLRLESIDRTRVLPPSDCRFSERAYIIL